MRELLNLKKNHDGKHAILEKIKPVYCKKSCLGKESPSLNLESV